MSEDNKKEKGVLGAGLFAAFDFSRRGYASFLACVFTMSLAAALVLKNWRESDTANRHFQSAVKLLLDTQTEPRPDIQRSAVTSIAIELGYVSKEPGCEDPKASVSCIEMRTALDEWARALEHPLSPKASEDAPGELEICPLIQRRDESGSAVRGEQLLRAPGLCSKPGPLQDGALFLSPFMFDCQDGSSVLDAWTCLGPRARAAVRRAKLLGPTVGQWLRKHVGGGAVDARPVQAFFLAPEGVLQLWSNEQRTEPMLNDFRGRDYVDGTRTSAERFETGIYLDVGGFGLVRSYCQRIRPEGENAGVICIDYVPAEGVPDPDQDVVDHARVDLGTTKNAVPTVGPAQQENASLIASRLQSGAGLVDVINVRADPPLYLVPLSKRGEHLSFVAVGPASLGPTATFWEMLVAVAVALGVAVYTVAVRRREFRIEDEYTILRKLQVGVLKADAEDNIIEGNDRAEELLGVKLRPLGMGRSRSAIPGIAYSALFEPGSAHLVKFQGPDAASLGEPLVVPGPFGAIARARSRGMWSIYYLRKRNPKRGLPESEWLRFDGSPLLDRDTKKGETFAIVTLPSASRREKLEKGEKGGRGREWFV